MSNDKFQIGGYEYSKFGGEYYRSKVDDKTFTKKISKSTYQKYYRQYGGDISTRTNLKLSEGWKKQLWSKSSWINSPWNNEGNRLQERLRPLTISDKRDFYGRVRTEAGRTNSQWGAKLSNGKYKDSVFVLNGLQDLIKHLQIVKHQMTVQAEHFRITVGQRALRVFQLSFKYHKFYNEDTDWEKLASYTRRKRTVAGTWFGSHKSKLYETGSMSVAFDYKKKIGNATRISTSKPHTPRIKMSVRDVIRGVPLKRKIMYRRGNDPVYAGIHNEGVSKGRKPGSKIPQRQFMGWSKSHSNVMDKIDSFAYEIADRYLFDSVFMVKKP